MADFRRPLTFSDLRGEKGHHNHNHHNHHSVYDSKSNFAISVRTFGLEIKANFENILTLYLDDWNLDTRHYLKVRCARCGRSPVSASGDPWIFVARDHYPTPNPNGQLMDYWDTCSGCQEEMTIRILGPFMPYTGTLHNSRTGGYGEVLRFEARGVDIVDYDLRGGWRAESTHTRLHFYVDFEDGKNWRDWDPKGEKYVTIKNASARIAKELRGG